MFSMAGRTEMHGLLIKVGSNDQFFGYIFFLIETTFSLLALHILNLFLGSTPTRPGTIRTTLSTWPIYSFNTNTIKTSPFYRWGNEKYLYHRHQPISSLSESPTIVAYAWKCQVQRDRFLINSFYLQPMPSKLQQSIRNHWSWAIC